MQIQVANPSSGQEWLFLFPEIAKTQCSHFQQAKKKKSGSEIRTLRRRGSAASSTSISIAGPVGIATRGRAAVKLIVKDHVPRHKKTLKKQLGKVRSTACDPWHPGQILHEGLRGRHEDAAMKLFLIFPHHGRM